jgi:hypothetical protein
MICGKCLKEIGFDDEPPEYDPALRLNKVFIFPVQGRPNSFFIRYCPVGEKELKNGTANYPAA